MVVAELAVVTELVRRLERRARHTRHLGLGRVDQLEELRKRRTQRQAAPALVADVRHPAELALELLGVEVVGIAEALFRGRALGGRDLHAATRRAAARACALEIPAFVGAARFTRPTASRGR